MPFTRHLPPCRGLRAPAPPPEFLSLAQGLGRWVDRPRTPGPTRTASWWSPGHGAGWGQATVLRALVAGAAAPHTHPGGPPQVAGSGGEAGERAGTRPARPRPGGAQALLRQRLVGAQAQCWPHASPAAAAAAATAATAAAPSPLSPGRSRRRFMNGAHVTKHHVTSVERQRRRILSLVRPGLRSALRPARTGGESPPPPGPGAPRAASERQPTACLGLGPPGPAVYWVSAPAAGRAGGSGPNREPAGPRFLLAGRGRRGPRLLPSGPPLTPLAARASTSPVVRSRARSLLPGCWGGRGARARDLLGGARGVLEGGAARGLGEREERVGSSGAPRARRKSLAAPAGAADSSGVCVRASPGAGVLGGPGGEGDGAARGGPGGPC